MPFSRPWRDGPDEPYQTPDPFPFSLRGSRSLCISTRLWLLHGRHIAAKYPEITSVTLLEPVTWQDLVHWAWGDGTCYAFPIDKHAYSLWYDKAHYTLFDIVSDLLSQLWPSIRFTGGVEPANDGQEHENKGGG